MSDPRDVFEELATLPGPALDAAVAERIRRRTRAAFVAAAPGRAARRFDRLAALWSRALEPGLAVGVSVIYLGWTVGQLIALSP